MPKIRPCRGIYCFAFSSRLYSRPASNTFGMPQLVRAQYSGRGQLLPGRMAIPTSDVDKSKSVDNLNNDPFVVLGLKSANSEINMSRHQQLLQQQQQQQQQLPVKPSRLRGTTSELNVSKLGQSEKVRLDVIEGIASLPAEMTRGLRPNQVKPNREKIRTILSMSNVIDLQRQLLTTVMENEVSHQVYFCPEHSLSFFF